jgi:hypothetical protein
MRDALLAVLGEIQFTNDVDRLAVWPEKAPAKTWTRT